MLPGKASVTVIERRLLLQPVAQEAAQQTARQRDALQPLCLRIVVTAAIPSA